MGLMMWLNDVNYDSVFLLALAGIWISTAIVILLLIDRKKFFAKKPE